MQSNGSVCYYHKRKNVPGCDAIGRTSPSNPQEGPRATPPRGHCNYEVGNVSETSKTKSVRKQRRSVQSTQPGSASTRRSIALFITRWRELKKGGYRRLFLFYTLVQLGEESVQIVTVNEYRLLYGFAVGHCTAEAVHTDSLQNFCAVGVYFKTVCNKRILGYLCHTSSPFIFYSNIISVLKGICKYFTQIHKIFYLFSP